MASSRVTEEVAERRSMGGLLIGGRRTGIGPTAAVRRRRGVAAVGHAPERAEAMASYLGRRRHAG